MPAPTLVSYTETTWSGTGSKSTAAVTWQTGDLVVVLAVNESANTSIAAPTGTGLVFTAGGAVGTAGSDCQANSWSATPAAGGSQVITSTGSGALQWGMAVWVWRGSGGIGTRATSITSAKTVSLVRSGANSCVVFCSGDFSAAASTGYSFTPAVANDRQHAVIPTTAYTIYVADFGNQGTAGTTSYGTSGETSSGPFTNLALEIKGTAAAPAVARQPRPAPRRLPVRARLGRLGLCAAGIASTIVTPLGAQQPHKPPVPVTRPAPHRAHAGPSGACGAGIAGPQPAAAAVTTAYHRPAPQISRRPPARAAWRGFASQIVTPRGTPGPSWRPQPGRPAPARGYWHGNAGPAAVVPAAAQAYQRPPPQARRPAPARGQWRGNASRIVIPAVAPARRPGPKITSRPRSRVIWRGIAGTIAPPVTALPKWRPLPSRRKPQRARTGGVRGLANAAPPPFTIGALTASGAPAAVLTAAGASSALTAATAPQGSLIAADQRTGGPG